MQNAGVWIWQDKAGRTFPICPVNLHPSFKGRWFIFAVNATPMYLTDSVLSIYLISEWMGHLALDIQK